MKTMDRFVCERCRHTTDNAGRCPHCGHYEVLDARAPDTELWLEVNDAMRWRPLQQLLAFLHDTAAVTAFVALFAIPIALMAIAPTSLRGNAFWDVLFLPTFVVLVFVLLEPVAALTRALRRGTVDEDPPSTADERAQARAAQRRAAAVVREAHSRSGRPVPGLER